MDTLTHATQEAAQADFAPEVAMAGAIVEARPARAPAAAQGDDPFLAMIERAARDPAIQVEKMERLFELSERARAARAKQAFASAFALMQPGLPTIDRRGKIVVYKEADRKKAGGPVEGVDVPQQQTPYATLENIVAAIRAPLAQHGFGVRFEHTLVPPNSPEGRIQTTAVLTHREGHSESATTPPLMHDSSGSKNSVQAVGSALTYGRRYALIALLAIVSHAPQDADDDGKATGAKPVGVITEDQVAELVRLRDETDSETTGMLKYVGATAIETMTLAQFEKAKTALQQKAKKGRAA